MRGTFSSDEQLRQSIQRQLNDWKAVMEENTELVFKSIPIGEYARMKKSLESALKCSHTWNIERAGGRHYRRTCVFCGYFEVDQ